jgi:cytochrome P450
MSLKDQITEDMKTAMRAKDSERLGTIRLLLAACKQKEVDERVVLDDAAVVGLVDKLIKQRKDSVAAYEKAARQDLADKESAEILVLQAYLPQRMSADEVLAMSVLLLIAGNETTTNLLSNAMVTLNQSPDQEALARRERTLVPALIDESLRFQSPVQLLFRRATADTEIAGVRLPKDSIVMPIFASANRDERAFEAPERVNIERTDLRNQLAFSWGIHLCVGKALANLEGELAMNALFDRYARVEVATPAIDWCDAFYLRGPKTLPVRVLAA